jgi:hypothetical protein
MVTIALVRKRNVLEEEYGRVLFDGKDIHLKGLSCVFVRYLERGLVDTDGMRYAPRDGAAFIRVLRREFSNDILKTREI